MNVGFLIDNSITMNQRAYNGLTLLQMAKSYVQKAIQNKNYLKILSQQFSASHLFTTSSAVPLSSYQDQQLHFTNQLKYIQWNEITDMGQSLKEMLKLMAKYRVMYGCETLLGNLQPYSRGANVIIILTDLSDYCTLQGINFRIKNGQLKTHCDYQVFFVSICPPSYYDKPSYQGIRKAVELDGNTKTMKQIAEYWNGKYYQINKYQAGFQVIDIIFNSFAPKINLKLQIIQKTSTIPHFRQSGINKVQRINQSSFLLKNEFNMSSIKPPMIRRSRIPLPVQAPVLKTNNLTNIAEIETFFIPSYIVDVSKAFDFPMSEFMPYQKIQFQSSHLSTILNQKLQKLRIQKIYIPVYYLHDQRQIMIGLLKAAFNRPLQLLFYFANFIQFNQILQFMIDKKPYDRIAMNSFELTVQQYARKIPPIYDFYISEFIANQRYKVNLRNRIPQILIKYNQQMDKIQYRERRIDIEKCMENATNHQKYMSECCAVFSNFYDKWSREKQLINPQNKQKNDMKKLIEKTLELKSILFPEIDDDIQSDKIKLKPITFELNNYSIKAGNQNEPLGNPYKKKKRPDDINITIDDHPPPIMQQQQLTPYPQQQIYQNNEYLNTHTPPITSITPILHPSPIIQNKQQIIQQAVNVPVSPIKSQTKTVDTPTQIMVSKLLSKFKINKPVKIRINSSNICLQQYQHNLQILEQNNVL